LFIDENYYKLCDFGCSQLFQNVSKASYNRHGKSSVSSDNAAFGTPAYIAPEIQISNNSKPNNSCDAWALGVILYELIYHRHPIGLNKLGKVESSDFRKFI
jgi:serine/threonine protein kinase